MIRQEMGSDPASVAYDTLRSAVANGADVVLIDTAGRLRNKVLHNQYNVYVLGRPWSLCIYFFMHFTGSTTYDDLVSFISGDKLPEFINSSYHIILFIKMCIRDSCRRQD